MSLKCIVSCKVLETNTVLTLNCFTQTRRMNDLLNSFWIAAAVLFYCLLSFCLSLWNRDGVWYLLEGDFFFFFLKVVFCFVVVANFLNFIALIISVSLDTWTIYSHPEIQALDLAKQELEQNSSLIQSANFPMLSLPCAQGQYLDLGFWTIFNPFLILS